MNPWARFAPGYLSSRHQHIFTSKRILILLLSVPLARRLIEPVDPTPVVVVVNPVRSLDAQPLHKLDICTRHFTTCYQCLNSILWATKICISVSLFSLSLVFLLLSVSAALLFSRLE